MITKDVISKVFFYLFFFTDSIVLPVILISDYHFFFQGVKQFSVPVGLDDPISVDLVIIGSVAVSPKGESKCNKSSQ